MPALSILIWLPAACGLIGALVAVRNERLPGLVALAGTVAALGLAIAYIVQYGPGSHGLKDVTDVVWISELGIHYKLGVSGLNVLLVGLTALLFFAAILATNLRSTSQHKGDAARRSPPGRVPAVSDPGPLDRPRLFYFHMMLAESAVLGAFLAQDLALFVAFFDLMLIPFYFLVGTDWGSATAPTHPGGAGPDRVKATIKLVIYTLVGSLLMLAAAIATGVLAGEQNGGHVTFVLSQLQGLPLSKGSQEWIFLFFAAAFLVKMPAFPLHGWMPDGYRAMPIEVLMVFSGVLSKVGAYGFLAIVLPLFPRAAAHFQTLMLILALASIIYGSAVAFTQTDARLIAGYSSVAQLGFITLGIFALNPQGAQGALLQMVNHGLVVAPIFFIIALLAQRAGGSEDIREMGGIAFRAPLLATIFLVVALATLAIPGSANFVGEFLILLGVFNAKLAIAVIAFSGVVMASVYALRVFIRAMHNRVGAGVKSREITPMDGVVLVPMLAVIVFLALYPQGALKRSEGSVSASVAGAHAALQPQISAPTASTEFAEQAATSYSAPRCPPPEGKYVHCETRVTYGKTTEAHEEGATEASEGGVRTMSTALMPTLATLKGPHVDFAALSPLIALFGGTIVVLLVGLLGSHWIREQLVPALSLGALGTALGLTIWRWNTPESVVSGALRIDRLSLTLNLILAVGGMATVLLAWRSKAAQEAAHGELHAMLLTTIGGMALLGAAQNTVALFLGLELLSIPLYVLCATEMRNEHSLEAGLKYLIVGSVGSATLLYGIALLYGVTGATDFGAIASTISGSGLASNAMLLTGIALCVAGLAFKASVAPFHQWTPDVYEGAPTPITAFMAVATKVAALGVLLRLFDVALIEAHASWGPALAALATITILVGNVGALGQSSLKRMLAYSSVAQAGYMLAGAVVATQLGAQAMVFYLAVYLAMNMAAFAVIVARERETDLGDSIQAMAGLGRERPWLAWPMTISMLALAGIPATAGFIGKFYLIDAAVAGGYTWLGVVIVVGSMISLGYYLPVIATMWMGSAPAAVKSPPPGATSPPGPIPAIAGGSPELDPVAPAATGLQLEVAFVAVVAGAATIFFGILPQPLFDLVRGVGSALGLL